MQNWSLKKAGVPRSTLWLYFSRKNYEKKAQEKKFTQGTPKDRIFCKIKFYFFYFYSFENQILAKYAKLVALKRPVSLDKLFGYILVEKTIKKKLKRRSSLKVLQMIGFFAKKKIFFFIFILSRTKY